MNFIIIFPFQLYFPGVHFPDFIINFIIISPLLDAPVVSIFLLYH